MAKMDWDKIRRESLLKREDPHLTSGTTLLPVLGSWDVAATHATGRQADKPGTPWGEAKSGTLPWENGVRPGRTARRRKRHSETEGS